MVSVEKRRMCPHCRAFITTSDKVCPYCDTPVGPKAIDVRSPGDLLGGLIPGGQFTTVLILTINVGMFLVTMFAQTKMGEIEALTLYGAARPDFVFAGQWWRLITAGFLHGGLMHIVFNSWALMDVGRHAEEIYGARRMVVIYLLSTIGGFLASMFWTRSVSVGASAGLFGLIGAMITVGVLHRGSHEAAAIKEFYIRWAVYGLLWGLLPFFRVDNAAHVGGLVTGFLTAWITGTPRKFAVVKEQVWGVICLAMVALTVYAFVQMFLWNRSVAG
jgi:rhomboid protease GluP